MKAPAHLFNTTCTTQRATVAVDAGGSPVSTYTNYLTGVPCRHQPGGGGETPRYGRESNRYSHTVYVESGQDIAEADRVVVAGLTLEIQGITDFDGLAVLTRLGCEETK